MTNINAKILKTLAIVDIVFMVSIVVFFDIKYLYASQVGFISSSLVVLASLAAYKRMVDTRVELNIITLDDSKDVMDQLEDPYDLYSEEIIEDETKDLVKVVKEERKKHKDHRSVYQMLKDTKAAFSVYRLGAYAVLILGFLYLNRNGLLHIPTYIIALGLPPLIIVFILLQEKDNN